MSTLKEIDLILKDNNYFKRRIAENKLRLNEIYFHHGIFNEVEFNLNKNKIMRDYNYLLESFEELKTSEAIKLEC